MRLTQRWQNLNNSRPSVKYARAGGIASLIAIQHPENARSFFRRTELKSRICCSNKIYCRQSSSFSVVTNATKRRSRACGQVFDLQMPLKERRSLKLLMREWRYFLTMTWRLLTSQNLRINLNLVSVRIMQVWFRHSKKSSKSASFEVSLNWFSLQRLWPLV